jgi:hypothetical protein
MEILKGTPKPVAKAARLKASTIIAATLRMIRKKPAERAKKVVLPQERVSRNTFFI